ncbi:MAG: YiiX/YebB-like N1pC/P60 family cysteine hydrolase [Bacteriovoracia bacterium]
MRILILLLALISLGSYASELQVGDVILQPLRCYSCGLIEAQEKSSFSHMGLVISTTSGVKIAEALGQVRIVTLAEFLAKGDSTRAHKIMRPREKVTFDFMTTIEPWLGAEFDRAFRWDNLGRDGREAFYCSEMVTKLLNKFLKNKMPTKPMDFSENFAAWSAYFNGDVPQGEPGISPGDYEHSKLFKWVASFQGGTWNWQ